MNKQELIEVERGFWFKGSDYYNQHVSEEVTFVFPGMRLNKDEGVTAADQAPRWDELEIVDEVVLPISAEVMVLTYRAKGTREGQEPYIGNITSVYRTEGGAPKLIFHQHTPDPSDR